MIGMIYRIGGFATALTALLASSAASGQAAQEHLVEQGFFEDVVAPSVCDVAKTAADSFLPGLLGDLLKGGADAVGLCRQNSHTEVSGGDPVVLGNINGDQIADLGREMRPALQINLVKVQNPDGAVRTLAAGPETVFEEGSGFAVVVLNNSPGYLEVWSIDQSSITFVEGIVLGDPGLVGLPETVSGYYRFTTSGGEDSLRFRFRACRLGTEQAFVAEENQVVAEAFSDAQRQMVEAFQDSLADCTFGSDSIDREEPQDALFREVRRISPYYAEEKGTYLLAVPDGHQGLVADINLQRF